MPFVCEKQSLTGNREGYMGVCDRQTTESILDYFYEQVSDGRSPRIS